MKILLVTSHYYPAFLYGGPIFSLHALAKAMVGQKVEVSVYTTDAFLEGTVPANKEVDVEGVKVTYFSTVKMLDFLGSTGWQYSFPFTRALKNGLEGFDLVYILGVWSYPVLAAAYYCQKYHKPYIMSPRGMLYPETFHKKWWKKVLYFNILIKKCMRRAACIHYTSEDETRCHSFLGLSNKMLVLPNGIDASLFVGDSRKENFRDRYSQLKGKRVILFLGRLVWKKGLDLLLEAYNEIAVERPDVHLVVVGSGEERFCEGLRRQVKDHGLSERVTFTGMLTGAQKLEAYWGSDIFVLPSYSENFGMAVVEAMACGLPIVISDMVGIQEQIKGANAGVVVQCEKGSLCNGILSLLNDQEKARRLALNGQSLIRDSYDIHKVATRFINVSATFIQGRFIEE